MSEERTAEGLELRLRPRGAGRFFGSAFLAVWLCGWAFGEVVVLWLLLHGARAVLTGQPPAPGRAVLEPGPAIAAGAFLLVWLTFWTFGGVMALRELVNSLWAEDRIVVGPDGLDVTRRRGPFRSRQRFARGQVQGVRRAHHGRALLIETGRSSLELSRLGTIEERESALEALRRELHLQDGGAAPGREAPEGWEEALTPEGERVVVADPRLRRQQATFVGALALGAAAGSYALVRETLGNLALAPLALMAGAATAGLAWGAAWLAWGRMEWRVGSGRLTLRRRWRGSLKDVFEARALELVATRDSDGDEWFALEAVAADVPPSGTRPARPGRRRVTSSPADPILPRRLGAWLASRADVPFADLADDEAREADLARLRARLEKSGGLGHLVGRLAARAASRTIRS